MMKSELLVLVRRFLMHLRVAAPHGLVRLLAGLEEAFQAWKSELKLKFPLILMTR
jgi:hypothetical protein